MNENLGWALVRPTICATEYMPVEVVRKGKRFTFVRTLSGKQDRYTTRGLWEVPTFEAAMAEIDQMRAYRNAKESCQ